MPSLRAGRSAAPAVEYALDVRDPSNAQRGPNQFVEYLQILRRNVWFLAVLAICGLGLGILITAMTPPVFQARISLDVKGSGENLPTIRNASSDGGYPPEGFVQTEIKILQSQSLSDRVVNRLKARHVKPSEPRRSLIPGWRLPVVPRDAAIQEAARTITVRPLGTTRIVEVLCTSRDPQVASEFCNTLAEQYIQQNLENRWRLTQETGEWLNRYVENVKHRLTRTEGDLQNSATAAALLFGSETDTLAQEKLRQVQNELSKSQGERMIKQSQYEMAVSNSADSLPMVLDNESLRTYQLKLTDLRRQIAELSGTLTPAHYKIVQLQAQVKEVQSTLERERGEIVKRMRNEFEAAKRREDLLAAAYATQITLVTSEAGKSVQHNMLKREVDSGRKVYETMLEKVEEVGLASAMRASTIRVLDAATTPQIPTSPSLKTHAAVGLSSGLFLGVIVAFIRVRSNRSLRGPGDTPLRPNVRELGTIPAVGIGAGRRWLKKSRRESKRIPSIVTGLPAGAGITDSISNSMSNSISHNYGLELTTWQDRGSVMAESINAIMNSILFSGASTLRAEVMVITSPEVGDGKTTVATNLAIALAQIKHKVLLVDGDTRQPRLHKVFRIPNKFGLLNILQDERPLTDIPSDELVAATPIPNLSVMPSGERANHSADLLHSDRLRELVWRLREEYDTILIDTPPMGLLSDARVLGRLAEGVLLVFRADKTTCETAAAAQQRFADDGTPVLGTILNDWDVRRNPRYGTYKNYNNYIRS